MSQYIFAFSQSTQDSARKYWKNCFSQSEFLVLADSYLSEISQEADVVLPLAPLYESEFHATSVENYTQFSDGVTLHHPNVESIKRGSQIVPPSLKLAMGPQK